MSRRVLVKGQKPGLAAFLAAETQKAPKINLGRLRLDLSIRAASKGAALK